MTNLFFSFFLQIVINLSAFEFFVCTMKNDYEKNRSSFYYTNLSNKGKSVIVDDFFNAS